MALTLVVQNSLLGLRGENTAKKTDSDPQKSKLTPTLPGEATPTYSLEGQLFQFFKKIAVHL